jgi:hypothetical protein
MRKIDFRVWVVYVAGTILVALITSPLANWLLGQPINDVLPRSIFMGLFMGTFLYFWDNGKTKKKQ